MKKPIQIESITEVRAVDPASLKCGLCRLVASLNAAGHCMHCERVPRQKDLERIGKATGNGRPSEPGAVLRVWRFLTRQWSLVTRH